MRSGLSADRLAPFAIAVLLALSCSTPEAPSSPSAGRAEVMPDTTTNANANAIAEREDSMREFERALADAYIPWNANEVLRTVGRIAETLNSSSYSPTIRVDVAMGQYSFDCSGMADWVLRRAAPVARRSVRGAGYRLLARDFYRAIASRPLDVDRGGWRRVARIDEAEPGDVVAWIKKTEVASRNTEHVAFIVRSPARLPGYENAYLVRIADSTSLYHDDDTRQPGLVTGFGLGTILLVGDEQAAPVAYGWVGTRARVFETKIAIGAARRRDAVEWSRPPGRYTRRAEI